MTYNRQLAERMRRRFKAETGAVEKALFGGIGFLINGNMACGLNKQDLIVRLSEHDFEQALKRPHVRMFNMTGRPMKGWIVVSGGEYASEAALKGWIDKAISHASSLPPK